MLPSRFRSHSALLSLLGATWLLLPVIARAGLCSQDKRCQAIAKRADQAMTIEQRRQSVAELKEIYQRIPDPRVLAIVGRLYQKEAQHQDAQVYCEEAKAHAPGDLDLQLKMTDCLETARKALAAGAKNPGEPVAKRVEAKGGTATVESTVINQTNPVNTVNVSPNITVNVVAPVPVSTPISQVAPLPPKNSLLQQRWVRWTGLGLLGVGLVAVAAVALGVSLAAQEPNTSGIATYPIALIVQ